MTQNCDGRLSGPWTHSHITQRMAHKVNNFTATTSLPTLNSVSSTCQKSKCYYIPAYLIKKSVHKCFYCSSAQGIHWYTFMFLNTQSQSTRKIKTYCHSYVWSIFFDNGLFLELQHYCMENTAELWISLYSDPVFDIIRRNSIHRYTNRPYTHKSWSSKVLTLWRRN